MENKKKRRRKRKEEEEEARKSKGKEKLADSPIPSHRPLPFPELSPEPIDFEAEIKLKQEQAEEERQEELATLNSLLDHYKQEAQGANASHREYEAKWLEVSTKLAQQEEIIVRLAQEGVDLLLGQQVENLKEDMRHMRQENKELNDKYQQVSSAYEDLVLKEPNTRENRLVKEHA